jgi:hypothetical protein
VASERLVSLAKAKKLQREIDAGRNPLGRRIEARQAPTVQELIDRRFNEYVTQLSGRSRSDQAAVLQTMVAPRRQSSSYS